MKIYRFKNPEEVVRTGGAMTCSQILEKICSFDHPAPIEFANFHHYSMILEGISIGNTYLPIDYTVCNCIYKGELRLEDLDRIEYPQNKIQKLIESLKTVPGYDTMPAILYLSEQCDFKRQYNDPGPFTIYKFKANPREIIRQRTGDLMWRRCRVQSLKPSLLENISCNPELTFAPLLPMCHPMLTYEYTHPNYIAQLQRDCFRLGIGTDGYTEFIGKYFDIIHIGKYCGIDHYYNTDTSKDIDMSGFRVYAGGKRIDLSEIFKGCDNQLYKRSDDGILYCQAKNFLAMLIVANSMDTSSNIHSVPIFAVPCPKYNSIQVLTIVGLTSENSKYWSDDQTHNIASVILTSPLYGAMRYHEALKRRIMDGTPVSSIEQL